MPQEVSKRLVSGFITNLWDLQPTYIGAIIQLLSTMDIPVPSVAEICVSENAKRGKSATLPPFRDFRYFGVQRPATRSFVCFAGKEHNKNIIYFPNHGDIPWFRKEPNNHQANFNTKTIVHKKYPKTLVFQNPPNTFSRGVWTKAFSGGVWGPSTYMIAHKVFGRLGKHG